MHHHTHQVRTPVRRHTITGSRVAYQARSNRAVARRRASLSRLTLLVALVVVGAIWAMSQVTAALNELGDTINGPGDATIEVDASFGN